MFKSYLKIGWRNLWKHKFHSFLNIAGLAIGIGFCFLVTGYAWSEWSFNKNLSNLKQQYIIQSEWREANMGLDLTTVGPMAKALRQQYTTLVANYYRWDGVTSTVSKGDHIFREGLQIGDSSLLNMFGFKLVDGDRKTALTEPFTVVITEKIAQKYFGRSTVVGEQLTIESFSGSKHDFRITGVMANSQDNSVTHLNPENDNQVFIPALSIDYFGRTLESWGDPYRVSYVELQPGVHPADVERAMTKLLKDNSSADIARNMKPVLRPLSAYYFSQYNGLVKKMLFSISAISFFILLMAVINFINLSVGRSSGRIREIGIRKVIGGLKKQLIAQFLVESLLLVSFSTMAALLIYVIGRPYLSEILSKDIPPLYDFPLYFAVVPIVLIFMIGLLSGIYPAFVLSSLKAVDSVKGKLKSVSGNIIFRKTLVGFQFCTASIVLIAAIITTKQVALFFSKELGYDKEFVVSVQTPRDWTAKGVQRMTTVRNEFARMSEVNAVSLSWSVPDDAASGATLLFTEGKDSSQGIAHETIMTDEHYLETFRIPLAAGRNYETAADSANLMINESAAKALGFKTSADAIGQRLYPPGGSPFTVIGVVKDFHFGTMKTRIKPLMMINVNLTKVYRLLCFKLKPGNPGESMASLQQKWSALLPGAAFEYRFMDESLNRLYRNEIRLKKASQVATALALIIVVLGIVGLISLSIQKRTKEIGIRKLLGASIPGITSLFLKDFIPVLIISGVVSVPLAWMIMQDWLNDYNYRIALTPTPFIVAILFLVLLTSFVIILQIARAALQSPVKNLRTE